MKTHTSRTAQFAPSRPQQEALPGQDGQQAAPPAYGLDFADNQKAPIQPLMSEGQQTAPASLPPPNNTGLPDRLKAGVEQLSGYSMDDVRVHYNSSKPAQLNALAYAQGTEIHIGPGQERHLPHEAWHVVQQKEGRVGATRQMQGMDLNDDVGLEKEADVMGGKAFQFTDKRRETVVQRKLQENYITKQPQPIQQKEIIQCATDPNKFNVIGENHSARPDYGNFFKNKYGLEVQVFFEPMWQNQETKEYGDPPVLRLEFLLSSLKEEAENVLKLENEDSTEDGTHFLSDYSNIFELLDKTKAQISSDKDSSGSYLMSTVAPTVDLIEYLKVGITAKEKENRKKDLQKMINYLSINDIQLRKSTDVRDERSRKMHEAAEASKDERNIVWAIGDNHVTDIRELGVDINYALTSKEEFATEIADQEAENESLITREKDEKGTVWNKVPW